MGTVRLSKKRGHPKTDAEGSQTSTLTTQERGCVVTEARETERDPRLADGPLKTKQTS